MKDKYNVHQIDQVSKWHYVATVEADTEDSACDKVAVRLGVKFQDLKAYPHIDNKEFNLK